MKKQIDNFEDSENLLINVIQREVNKRCGLPAGYNTYYEFESPDSLTIVGITVTDADGKRVGGVFKDEDEVREFFASGYPAYVSGDELASMYVNGVRESGAELTWDIVHTAFCAGMNEQRLQFERLDQLTRK